MKKTKHHSPKLVADLDVDRLHEVLNYDPETGVFTWRVRIGGKCKMGQPAGQIRKEGYRSIGIDGEVYSAQHLAWLHFYQKPPKHEIDFINGDRADVRIANLRLATRADNCRNAVSRPNRTGYRGVNKWFNRFHAKIRHNGKRITIGTFDTAEEAAAAYREKAKELHGDFALADNRNKTKLTGD